MSNDEVRIMNDELKEEKAEGFVYQSIDAEVGWRDDSGARAREVVYHKVDLPMPDIDYVEPEGSRESLASLASRESLASPVSQASHRSVPERAAFVARPVSEWVAEIVGKATPARVFDDVWAEGEMAGCIWES